MKTFDRLYRFLFIGSFALFLAFFAQKQTDRFTIRAITPSHDPLPFKIAYAFSENEKETLQKALSQPYHYFVSGGQTFVFLSADGRYVIKFLKQRLYRPSWWLNHLPLPSFLHRYRDKRNFKRVDKWNRDFFSYTEAFATLRKESGLIFCHLGATDTLKQKLVIKDRLGIQHTLDLDKMDFFIQHLAETVAERIERLQHDRQAIVKTFRQIIEVTKTCIDKGLYNRDPFIPHNCGFVQDQAIQIDVGRFLKRAVLEPDEELERITHPFESWLQDRFPLLVPLFQEELR